MNDIEAIARKALGRDDDNNMRNHKASGNSSKFNKFESV